jgi:dTDP-4-amino-4,6-dideoxygalactose transaminase
MALKRNILANYASQIYVMGVGIVSLPISAKLTDDEVQDVIAAVFRVLGGD